MFIEHVLQNTWEVEKHLEKEIIIPEWLFQEPIENEIKNI